MLGNSAGAARKRVPEQREVSRRRSTRESIGVARRGTGKSAGAERRISPGPCGIERGGSGGERASVVRGRVGEHLGDEHGCSTKEGNGEARKRVPGKPRGEGRRSTEQRAGIARKRSLEVYSALRRALPRAPPVQCAAFHRRTPPLYTRAILHTTPALSPLYAVTLPPYTPALPFGFNQGLPSATLVIFPLLRWRSPVRSTGAPHTSTPDCVQSGPHK